jgi:D-glycero-alpha-D-manno-heptose-7-phosphate kinase
MIIVQSPLRVSFFGGGTDFRSYFAEQGGCVLSSAIDKHIFVIIKRRFDRKLRIGYTRTELVDSVAEIQHELIREALRLTGVEQGVEITTMADIPSAGSGLGSSSTVTVGALHALYAYRGDMVTAECLARQACEIEIDRLGKPIGIQDQYIAAYGGFRFMAFTPDGEVVVQTVALTADQRRQLNENLLLFYTGVTRSSAQILEEQRSNINGRGEALGRIKQLALAARDELMAGNLDCIGELLHEGWELKKTLASRISNGEIDQIYQAARAAGALGGKISGAGGGGFLLLYCPHERQARLRNALRGLQELPFRLEPEGTKVIFNYSRAASYL